MADFVARVTAWLLCLNVHSSAGLPSHRRKHLFPYFLGLVHTNRTIAMNTIHDISQVCCIVRLILAEAGIANSHVSRCCPVIPRPLVKPPLVLKLHISTCSMTRSVVRPAQYKSLLLTTCSPDTKLRYISSVLVDHKKMWLRKMKTAHFRKVLLFSFNIHTH